MIKQITIKTYKSAANVCYNYNLLLYTVFRPASLNIQQAFTYIAFTHLVVFNILLTLLDEVVTHLPTQTVGGFLLSIVFYFIITGYTRLLSVAYLTVNSKEVWTPKKRFLLL